MSLLREMLARAVALRASDIHIKSGQKPVFRLDGDLVEAEQGPVTIAQLREMVDSLLPRSMAERYEAEREVDFSHSEEGVGRFRVNLFQSQGEPTLALRYVKDRVPTFEELQLPPVLTKLALTPRGLAVICGPTGCGKSTTLAAMVQQVNMTQRSRIITVEDPIEYLFRDDKSLITQREVGIDTLTFHAALKHVIRQDPDIIVIGEMRDTTTFQTALSAAETGHMVFTTLHAGTAPLAVQRILEFFPSGEREQVRMALAGNLHAVVCQRLLSSTQGRLVPAVEILVNSPTVHKLLEKDKLELLSAAIETGVDDGMQSFNQAIYKLIKGGMVTEKEGMLHATNPQALKMNLQGVFLDESKRILAM